jgi:hypothetical protein
MSSGFVSLQPPITVEPFAIQLSAFAEQSSGLMQLSTPLMAAA